MENTRHYLSLIYEKATSDLKADARRGSLGILWWVVEPILYMAVFYGVFYVVLHRGTEGAVYSLLIGLVVWKWFDSSVRVASNCIVANAGLIRQVYLPKIVLPVMAAVTNTMKFFIVFFILVFFLIYQGQGPSLSWFVLPIIMLIQFFLILCVGSFLASLVPIFPDLKMLVDNGMTLLFFASGIFFDIGAASPEAQRILYLNPMAGIIDSYRLVLLEGKLPDWGLLFTIAGSASIIGGVGVYLLARWNREYLKVV